MNEVKFDILEMQMEDEVPEELLFIEDDAERAQAICDLAVTENGIERGAYLIGTGIAMIESLGGGEDDDMYYQTCVKYLQQLKQAH